MARRPARPLAGRRLPARAVRQARGPLLHPHSLSQAFTRVIEETGLTLHWLRHTPRPLLLKAGVPLKVVSERLGHAKPAFTMATYQHVLPGMQADAAATFATLLDDAR